MIRRLLSAVAVLGLALLPAAPAHAEPTPTQPQTVTFTSTPPSGVDWFSDDGSIHVGYVAEASASSGLPVTYSLDPASTEVCEIDDFSGSSPFEGKAAIRFVGPGSCTIRADQEGDETYLPAPQASQSFVIDKVASTLSDLKARKVLRGGPSASFRATLQVPINLSSWEWGLGGYPGQVVTFSVAGTPVCSATTDTDGVATCTAPLPLITWLTQPRFTASYAGDALYEPATASAAFVG
jgi:hypothetical protein